ncbi:MAG TPA: hypothetical protein G4N94_00730 [Caldilineae bacterium]|nr:hypothetical protein [Caldilineae bacterium]
MNLNLQETLRLIGRGLFLEPDAYDEAAESDNPFVDGLFLVILIGVVIAIAGVIGQAIGWAMTPDLSEIKQIIYDGLLQSPMFGMLQENADAIAQFKESYEQGWRIAEFFSPNITNIFIGLFLRPLGLLIAWLWFALIAHGAAKALGGNGSLQETLGATALALSPALLHVFGVLPTITVAAVGVWILLARYVAVRRVHENLTWGRSLAAVVSPMILSWLLLIVLGVFAAFLMSLFIGGFAS